MNNDFPLVAEVPLGLWRSGRSLVVSRRRHRFPERCIKTNRTGEICRHGVKVGFTSKNTLLDSNTVFGVTVGDEDPQFAYFPLEVGLSRRWYLRRQRATLLGWTFVLGGIGTFFGAVFGYMACMAGGIPESIANWLLLALAVGPVAAIAGLIPPTLNHGPILSLEKVTPDDLWLTGVHADFLKELPEWSPG